MQVGEVTQLLLAWSNGDKKGIERLAPLVESELRRVAYRCIEGERRDHSVQATALVNEAYLRLIDWKTVGWQNRAHFFGVAAKIMRRILVNHARDRGRQKRGGTAVMVSLDEVDPISPEPSFDVLALDEALEKLAGFDGRKCQIVELRFFGGLSEEETAEVLRTSLRTVQRDWNLARAWLLRELSGEST